MNNKIKKCYHQTDKAKSKNHSEYLCCDFSQVALKVVGTQYGDIAY